MASISLNHIKKVYPGDIEVISDLNLQIKDKEFVVLVGPSGCGKSTTLRMIAGLEEISDGEMYIGDRKVNDVAPKDRDIAMVFQNYALYPHMTVYKNMAFALKLRKTPKDEIDRKVHEAAKVLDIEHLLNRKPKQLSGGQRQRVALGRAMVRDRRYSCSMSRCPIWMPSCVPRCAPRSSSCIRSWIRPLFTLRMTRPRP